VHLIHKESLLMVRTFVRMAAIAAVPLTLALTPISTAASAPLATIQILDQAPLQQDGSVALTVDYSCNPGFFGSQAGLFADVQQPGVFGSSSTSATCDDQKHQTTLIVSPGPFQPGSATAFVQVFGSSFVSTQAEITVK
jgi:hypothetical protein